MIRNVVTVYPGHIDLTDHGQMATPPAVMIERLDRVAKGVMPAFQ